MTQTDLPTFTLGDRLAKARDWAGLTQEQMASALGIGRRSIVRYESGKVPPRPAVIAWATVTRVPLWWIDDTHDTDGGTSVDIGQPTRLALVA